MKLSDFTLSEQIVPNLGIQHQIVPVVNNTQDDAQLEAAKKTVKKVMDAYNSGFSGPMSPDDFDAWLDDCMG